MKKENGLPIYRRTETDTQGNEKLIREQSIGSDWNLGEKIQAEKLDILQLTFLMEELREHLPIIRDWAYATEYNGQDINAEEQIRRQEIFAEVLNHYEYLNEVRSRDFRRSLVTFEQLRQDPIFQIRAQRLLELVQGEGLMKELEKRLDTMTVGVEQKESYDHDLLPSEYFDPNLYTRDMVAESASHLAVDIELYIEQKYGNTQYAKELQAVVACIHNVVENGMFNEDGLALNENFSLLWIKQSNPRAWQALQTLIHEADGQEILRMILGKPTVWEDTSGIIKKTGKETNEEREKEMFLRLGNPLHMALARSVENLSEGENASLKGAEKEVLQELYGKLPEELEFDLENHMLNLEIRLIMEKMDFESKEEAYEFERLVYMLRDVSESKWGKAKKIENIIQVPSEVWKSFLPRFFNAIQGISKEGDTMHFWITTEHFEGLQKVITTLIEFLEKGVGFETQKSLLDSRKTKWPLLKALLSGSGSPDARIFDIERKVRELRQKEEKCLSVTHTFLSELNYLIRSQDKQWKEPNEVFEKKRSKLLQMVRSVNRKYLSHVCGVKETLDQRAQYDDSLLVDDSNTKNLASSDPLCDFRGWHLRGNILEGLHLQNMDFRGCDMYKAVLGGKQVQEIRNCNFSNVNMAKVSFQRVNFQICDFIETDFTHAESKTEDRNEVVRRNIFSYCCFDRADLRYGNFYGVRIQSCRGTEADFSGAQFNDCTVEGSILERTNFNRTKFIQSKFLLDSFIDGNFNQSTFVQSHIKDTQFQGGSFDYEVDMDTVSLENCTFELDNFNINLKKSFSWNGGELRVRGACNMIVSEFKEDDTEVFRIQGVHFCKIEASSETWFFPYFFMVDGGTFTNITFNHDENPFPESYRIKGVSFENVQFSPVSGRSIASRGVRDYVGCEWKDCRYVSVDGTVHPLPDTLLEST